MAYSIQSELLAGVQSATMSGNTITLASGERITFSPHESNPSVVYAEWNGTKTPIHIRTDDSNTVYLSVNGYTYPLTVMNEREQRFAALLKETATATSGVMKVPAPMPGLIKSVLAKNGQHVKKNEKLFVLEAMKMENDIKSPAEGIIANLTVQAGTAVEKSFLLCVIEPLKQA